MKPIYIFDQATANRRNWSALGHLGAVPQDLTNTEEDDLSANGAPVSFKSVFVCVIHFTRLNDGYSSVTKWAKKYPKARFIAISGSPLRQPEPLLPNVLCYRNAVGQDLSTDPFKQSFIDWYRQWSGDQQYPWGPLDFDETPLHALRLLCEAWEATDGQPTGELSGITIHAPQNLDDWLAPFKKDDQSPAPNPSEVATLMKDAERTKKAQAVFDAAGGKDALTLKDAVEEFLKPTNPKPTE